MTTIPTPGKVIKFRYPKSESSPNKTVMVLSVVEGKLHGVDMDKLPPKIYFAFLAWAARFKEEMKDSRVFYHTHLKPVLVHLGPCYRTYFIDDMEA